ncbi:MAG: serine hydrolase [Verrucomicrobia bacterium]|nr:serine hydrolase [Verrucomicrobiota bacterium]MDA1066466.1 serine hydrolase [Verrucomicrobiota bacterium]
MTSRRDSLISTEEINAILTDRIDGAKKSTGMVIGLIEGYKTRIISLGNISKESNQPVNGDTIFEIGSVSKLFTAVLLADMHLKSEIKLSDPISSFLPEGVRVPTYEGREIDLLSLVSHRSGLPRMPSNLNPKELTQPLADYSHTDLYEFLSGYQLDRPIGETYEYSNIGYALLGHLLERRTGLNYATLIHSRVCEPLKMTSTSAKLEPMLNSRLAVGHGQQMEAVPPCQFSTFESAGSIRSSANDMLRFISANLESVSSPMGKALALTRALKNGSKDEDGFGWVTADKFDAPIYWHNGGTNGFHSFVGFREDNQTGVVVLSNSVSFIDDIGLHILERQYPLAKRREAIQLTTQLLQDYVGEYRFKPKISFHVSLEGEELLANVTGQPPLPIYPESETEFFFEFVDARLKFIRDEAGQVIKVELHQMGIVQVAVKSLQEG